MRSLRLLSTTAAVLLLGAGAVLAQGTKTDERPDAPAAQQNAPAEKVAPTLKSGQRKAPETTGQATAPKSDKLKSQTMDMDRGTPAGGGSKSSSDADLKSKGTNSQTESAPGAASPSSKSAEEGKGSTTGQGKLSRERRTQITTIVMQHKVAPVRLNVSVEVGTRVPDSVHLYPLPQRVFAIYPEWRGYEYIMVGDEIVVINPHTHEIVAIIEA
jgi:Protein of unknown function (DUF1236)